MAVGIRSLFYEVRSCDGGPKTAIVSLAVRYTFKAGQSSIGACRYSFDLPERRRVSGESGGRAKMVGDVRARLLVGEWLELDSLDLHGCALV